MEPTIPSCSFDINELDGSVPLIGLTENYGAPIAELQDSHQPAQTQCSDITAGKEVGVYPFTNTYIDGSDAQNVVSPISQIETRYPFSASDWPSLLNPISPIDWNHQDPRGPYIVGSSTPNISLPIVYRNNNSDDDSLLTTQDLVGELSELVQVLNSDWMQRLKPLVDSSIMNLVAAARSPFEKGLRALQQFYRGVLPNTFEDAFSLMHIALASVYTFHHDDAFYPWDAFFDEILRWHQAIAKDSEKSLFLEVAAILWSAPKDSKPVGQGSESINEFNVNHGGQSRLLQHNKPHEPESLVSLRIHRSARSSPHGLEFWYPPLAGQYRNDIDLFHELKNGQIMKVCSQYLDRR